MINRFQLTADYDISRVINGGWQLSDGHALQTPNDMKDARNAFAKLLEEGFDTFDCADIYTGVEDFIGGLVKDRKASTGKDDIKVHTKFVPDLNELKTVDYDYVERIITRSLKRLNKERLDLVQYHWWDYEIKRYVEVAEHLVTLQKKGLIRNIACTNFDTPRLKDLLDAGIPVVSNQIQYSILDHRPEYEMVKLCKDRNVKLICYGSLSGGFLAEKWMNTLQPKSFENRSLVKYSLIIEDTTGWDGYQTLLKMLQEMAQEKNCSVANIASAYVLKREAVAAVIIGTRSSRHIEGNKKIFEIDLTEADIAKIDGYMAQYPLLEGEPFALEREVGGKHREIMKMNLADV